jgi:exodeoxyribonuclease VII small subunit
MSTTESFNENYAILKGVADTLRNQQTPDIDELIPQVDKGMTAYKNCVSRLDQVSAMLEERLKTGDQAAE